MEPHQPQKFAFPRRQFGKKNVVERAFQPLWFQKFTWLHYDENCDAAFCYLCSSAEKQGKLNAASNARFTLADPMPRLGSDVVGGNSGRNHPTSRRHTIHIGRMARNVPCPFASVGTRESYNIVRLPGWYGERVLFITTLSCVVHVRLPIGRRRRAILNMASR